MADGKCSTCIRYSSSGNPVVSYWCCHCCWQQNLSLFFLSPSLTAGLIFCETLPLCISWRWAPVPTCSYLCARFVWVATTTFLKPTVRCIWFCIPVGDIFFQMFPLTFIYISKDWQMLLENPRNIKHFDYFCHSEVWFRHFSNWFVPLI